MMYKQAESIIVGLVNKAWLSQYRDAKCTPDMIKETFTLMREARSQDNIELEQSYYLNLKHEIDKLKQKGCDVRQLEQTLANLERCYQNESNK